MCIGKCENFAHNYVSNPSNMKCEYCGPTCSHCTLQYGCSKCFGEKGTSSDPREYLFNLDETKEKATFPFTFSPYTKYGAPSSEFATCMDCNNYDERCDSCYDATELFLKNKDTKPPEKKKRFLQEDLNVTEPALNETDAEAKNKTVKKVMDKVPIER